MQESFVALKWVDFQATRIEIFSANNVKTPIKSNLCFTLDKPTIAAVHGYILGDTMQQALLCDIIIASENTILGFIGPKGGALCYGSFTVLPAIVGCDKAAEMLFTWDQISAEEGYRGISRLQLSNKSLGYETLLTAVHKEEIIKNLVHFWSRI